MKKREHSRYIPPKEIHVAILLPPRDHPIIVMGRLIDISQSGLAITHLPLDDTIIPIKTPCEVMLKIDGQAFTKPVKAEIVYETQLNANTPSDYSHPINRYGVKFINFRSGLELQEKLLTAKAA